MNSKHTVTWKFYSFVGVFSTSIFYLKGLSSSQEAKALKTSVRMTSAETSAVDAALSGPTGSGYFSCRGSFGPLGSFFTHVAHKHFPKKDAT